MVEGQEGDGNDARVAVQHVGGRKSCPSWSQIHSPAAEGKEACATGCRKNERRLLVCQVGDAEMSLNIDRIREEDQAAKNPSPFPVGEEEGAVLIPALCNKSKPRCESSAGH